MIKSANRLSFAQEQRLHFVEAVLLWEGSVQRQRVCDVFGIAANHVTKDLRAYQERHPGSLEYKPNLRSYVPGPDFRPVFASQDPAMYLALLQAHLQSDSKALIPVLGSTGVTADVLPMPPGSNDAGLLRLIVQAIRNRTAIDVTYDSMSADSPRRRRIWPHALISTGTRWDLRAFDSLRNDFRNFVMQRIGDPRMVREPAPRLSIEDADWQASETLDVIPNPRLNRHQQQVVAKEYGMRRKAGIEWLWTPRLRRCLIGYFVARYSLDAPADANPQRHRIVLRNRDTVKRYFLPAES